MRTGKGRWIAGAILCVLTSFCVFVLPFLLPPPVLHGQSAANMAGFNNKVATVAAVICSLLAIAFHLRYGWADTLRTRSARTIST